MEKTQQHEASWKALWGDVALHGVLVDGIFGIVSATYNYKYYLNTLYDL